MGRHRFEALDGIRGLAALAVLLLHVCQTHAPWVFPRGYLAVDLFFVLSGFVIAYAYEARLVGGLPKTSFLYARVVRLYPLIVAGAVVGLVGYSKLYDPLVLSVIFVTGLLLLPTPFAPPSEDFMALPVNPPSWSLFFEIAINIVFMVIAPRLSNRKLACLVITSALLLLIEIVYFDAANFGAKWTNFGAGTARVCFSFFMGVGLHRLWQGQKLTYFRVHFGLILIALMLIFMIPTDIQLTALFDAVGILILLPAMVACGTNVSVSDKFLPLCIVAGELSYPAYILQGGIASHIRDLPTKFGAHGATALAIIGFSVAIYIFLCWVVLKVYDVPVRRFLTHDVKFLVKGRKVRAL